MRFRSISQEVHKVEPPMQYASTIYRRFFLSGRSPIVRNNIPTRISGLPCFTQFKKTYRRYVISSGLLREIRLDSDDTLNKVICMYLQYNTCITWILVFSGNSP